MKDKKQSKIMHYTITFHTDWHCGSGLAAGADVDALVVKDADNMPYVPGKTMKGLVREAVEELRQLAGETDTTVVNEAFGYFDDKEDKQKGQMFFTNAELCETERKAIVANKASRYLYRSISSTCIDKSGVAKDHSLRKMEVVVPCVLTGEVRFVPEEMLDTIERAMKYIKRMGQNRNRGLGRCTISVVEKGDEK